MSYEVLCSSHGDRGIWLEARRQGIGSSDAAAICGLNPWSSPTAVYASKIGAFEDEADSEAAYWGLAIEPLVAERFASETGRSVKLAGELLRSKALPWQLATLDATQTDPMKPGPGVLEIKCTSLRSRWDEGVPDFVEVQVQHQLAVTGYEWASVGVLFGGREFFWADIERNESYIAGLTQIEAAFWESVLKGEPPQKVDGSEATERALKALYPSDKDEVIRLDGEWTTAFEDLKEFKADKADLEKQIRALTNQVKAEMKTATCALLPNGNSFTLTETHRVEHVVKASSYRTLRMREALR